MPSDILFQDGVSRMLLQGTGFVLLQYDTPFKMSWSYVPKSVIMGGPF